MASADLSQPDVEGLRERHCEYANSRGIRQIQNRDGDEALTWPSRTTSR